MPGPLAGVRVLDFSWVISGPFATMILADMGAEVIKVEAVGLTERDRGFGPYVGGMSTFRFSLDRGKRSMAIDLRKEKGRVLVYCLAPYIDVVVENFTPGTVKRLGVDYETLQQYNPRLVYASSAAYGQHGPYAQQRALDIVIQGVSGLLRPSSWLAATPTNTTVPFVDYATGIYIAVGVLGALLERERSGVGQYIDISMLDCALSFIENHLIRYSARDEVRPPRRWDSPFVWPHGPYEGKDGWMVVAQVHNWKGLCEKIGRPDLGEDPRYQTNSQRVEHREELESQLAGAFRGRSVAEWMRELGEFCTVAPVNTIEEVLQDPQVQARQAIVSLPVPGAADRELLVPQSPLRMSRTPVQVRGPGPRYQQHTAQVLREILGMSDTEIAELEREGVIGCLKAGEA